MKPSRPKYDPLRDLDGDGDIDAGDNAINDLDRDGRIDADDREIYDLDNDNDIDATDRELKRQEAEAAAHESTESVGEALGLTKKNGEWQRHEAPAQEVPGNRIK